ncbi:methyl-accepting chemotaxis protein [Photobacterium sp. SDRW27]|uniref:methyl-accepting chemotaxis protein n=1 Tax=Photobacterium obscurum TaxID=2829490 RepID=UPI00224303D2|nr:PAS domain-containing methyl-accepting chemotaxis protein [Photobacterium obscurum]MCW8329989.1 methyl-accepting chemotaxis protein [Photobacterium obscurum]
MTRPVKQASLQNAGKAVDYSASLDLISTTDPQSHITYANQTFCDIAGYTKEELVDQPHNLVRHGDMPKKAFEQLWQYVKAGKSWMGIVKNRCKNGDYYWVSAFVTPITDEKGQIIEYQSVRSRPNEEDVKRATDAYSKLDNNSDSIASFRFRQGGWLNSLLLLALLGSAAQLFVDSSAWLSVGTTAMLLAGLGVSAFSQSRLAAIQELAKKAYDNPVMEPIYTGKKDDYSVIELALRMRRAELRAIVGRASETSGDILISAEDEFANTQQIKTNLSQQAEATEQVSVAMGQMSSTVREVAESAAQASELATQAQQMAASGQTSVESTIESVHSLHSELDNSKQVINALSESSRQIEGILDVIGSIADQTNLLALNAAIEAARAGEAGRGFAVVADEVRSLAQKTQSQTGEIHQMINHLQETAKQAVDAVERGGELSEHCRQQAIETGTRLNEINEMLNKVTGSSHQIASAVEEQAGVSDEIARNVEHIGELTLMTSQTSDMSVESTRMLVERLEALQRLMVQFKRG